MDIYDFVRWFGGACVFVATFGLLAGCDVPTEGPSFTTETEVRTPLVAEKTFSFLGGPNSENEPLVDTTTSTFDSLFTVGESPKDITIEQTVDNFDIGELDEAIDQAAGDLTFEKQFSEPLIRDSDISAQEVDASYSQTNEVYESGDGSIPPIELYDNNSADQDGDTDVIVIPFPTPGSDPDEVLEAPNFGAVDASGATIEAVTLTEESGSDINEIDFTLGGSNQLSDGSGGAPKIQIEGAEGNSSDKTGFGTGPIPDGESRTITVDVSGLTFGENTKYRLIVAGTDGSNTASLEANLSEWHYQAARLSDAQNVSIDVSQSDVSTVGDDASQFEGIEVESGGLTLAIDNQFSFDLKVDQIKVENNNTPNWVSISPLGIDTSFPDPIPSGEGDEIDVSLSGKGIASSVSVDVTASPAKNVITVTADDVFSMSNTGTLNIQKMYFLPNGEEVQTSGTVELDNDQVTFEDGDYVELANGLIDVSQLEVDPQVNFEEFALTYPDLRHPDGSPVVVRFVKNPSGKFEFDQIVSGGGPRNLNVSFENEDIRVSPKQAASGGQEIEYTIRGTLETDQKGEGIVDIGDQVSADMSVGEFDIQELKVSEAEPFSVQVTKDVNEDGTLDLADDAEVRTASFEGFGGIADHIDNLQLSGSNLNFSLETKNLTDTEAHLYAALQGKSENNTGFFLAGEQNTDRGVSSASFEKDFVDGGTAVANASLIRFNANMEGMDLGTQETHTLPVNDENSNVSSFLSQLPTELRLAGQARMNEDGGDIALRKPVTLDAGFDVSIPLQFEGEFEVHHSLDADFSSLEDLTDPDKNLNVSKAALQFSYVNELPLGADVEMTIVEEGGAPVQTFTAEDGLRIEPAPKEPEGSEGAGFAAGSAEGTVTLSLGESKEALNALASGRKILLTLTMTQSEENAPARTRADDTIRLSVKTDVEASVRVGE